VEDPSWKPAQQTAAADDAVTEHVQTKNPVTCHICGRVFRRSNHLTQHLRSHSGLSVLHYTFVLVAVENILDSCN